jgi:hypothetical protein
MMFDTGDIISMHDEDRDEGSGGKHQTGPSIAALIESCCRYCRKLIG